jgi:hypothetical protein
MLSVVIYFLQTQNVEEKKEKYIGLEVYYRMAIERKVL